jgi:hypothetical protein
MSKNAVTKKTATGLANLVSKPAASAVETKNADTEQPPKKLSRVQEKDLVSLTLRVSREQYRKLVEARLDERSTIHALILKAVAERFERKHGISF